MIFFTFMKKIIYLLLFLLYIMPAHAQYENIWLLGNGGLNFNVNPVQSFTTTAPALVEAAASICDPQGRLLFLTDGTKVWDRNYNLMANGTELARQFGTGSSTQGAIIIPIPGSVSKYFIFSTTSVEYNSDAGKLYYTKVDMNRNGGLGAVDPLEKSVLVDSHLTEGMTAVVGAQCNIWLIVRSRIDGRFKSYEISDAGLNTKPVTSATGIIGRNRLWVGSLCPSPDSKKILSCSASPLGGGLETFDFNPGTGMLSHPQLLDDSLAYYAGCFSPDGSKVYAVTHLRDFKVLQYDLNAANPALSSTLISACPSFSKIKLAPDRKIYFKGGANYLNVIQFPDLAGGACGLKAKAVEYDSAISEALPNIVPIMIYDTAMSVNQIKEASCFTAAASLTLQANNSDQAWGHQWSNGVRSPSINPEMPGMYWVSYYTAPCRYHIDTFFIRLSNGVLPQATITEACKGTATGKIAVETYSGDTVLYRYTWYDEQDSVIGHGPILDKLYAGNYRLQVQTARCDTLLTFNLPESKYNARFQTDSLTCTGMALSVNNRSDVYYTQWHWDFGDGWQSSERSPDHTYRTPGVYEITLIASGLVCRDTFSSTVMVDAPMFPFQLYAERDTLCPGESLNFHYATDSTLVLFQWELNGEYRFHTRDTFLQQAFDEPGLQTFVLTAELRACPVQQITKSVFIAPLPLVQLGNDTFLCLQGNSVVLSNKAAVQPGDQYLWNTGDSIPALVVRQPDDYQLRITNRFGCSNIESVTVHKDCYTDIPNVFTPNGDGINDYFFPRQHLSRNIAAFHFQIWNRWGQMLFETRSIDGRGWDGKQNGQEQPSGSYVYQLKIVYHDGKQESYNGNITLVR